MSVIVKKEVFAAAHVVDLLAKERGKALSRREWKHRIAGYGYNIRETENGSMIETLPHHVEICPLPADLCA